MYKIDDDQRRLNHILNCRTWCEEWEKVRFANRTGFCGEVETKDVGVCGAGAGVGGDGDVEATGNK